MTKAKAPLFSLRGFFAGYKRAVAVGVLLTLVGVGLTFIFVRTGQRPSFAETQASAAPNTEQPPPPARTGPPIFFPPDTVASEWTADFALTAGLFTFRGNPTRSFYGRGPIPQSPEVIWSYPNPADTTQPLCSAAISQGEQTRLCGLGWTGQPAILQRQEHLGGGTWLIFGAYDRKVHFLDAQTGRQVLPPFTTGDIVKGSVSIDPDNFPLIYAGSRDNYLRVIAIDGDEPRELWKLSAYDELIGETLWNDDWDSSPLVINDYLLAGGENSNLHIIRLNRGYDEDGRVRVNPQLVFVIPGWDDELLEAVGDTNVSIENSPVLHGSILYFGNSGGFIQGWNLSRAHEGRVFRVFDFWAGDDTDSSITLDSEGMLYVGVERERMNERTSAVGQIIKINPRNEATENNPLAPLEWSVFDPEGVSSTLAVQNGQNGEKTVVYATTQSGRLLAIDAEDGEILWEENFPGEIVSSPAVIDGTLVVSVPVDPESQQQSTGWQLRAYDVSELASNPAIPAAPSNPLPVAASPPALLWALDIDGEIEATPAIWEGRIFLGTRSGYMLGIADVEPAS